MLLCISLFKPRINTGDPRAYNEYEVYLQLELVMPVVEAKLKLIEVRTFVYFIIHE